MANVELTTNLLKTQLHEFTKQYITYDAYSRPEYVYTTGVNTINGGPCSIVRYSYSGTSTRVVYMKEYSGAWDTSWETF